MGNGARLFGVVHQLAEQPAGMQHAFRQGEFLRLRGQRHGFRRVFAGVVALVRMEYALHRFFKLCVGQRLLQRAVPSTRHEEAFFDAELVHGYPFPGQLRQAVVALALCHGLRREHGLGAGKVDAQPLLRLPFRRRELRQPVPAVQPWGENPFILVPAGMDAGRRNDVSAVRAQVHFRREPRAVADLPAGMPEISVPALARLHIDGRDRHVRPHPVQPFLAVHIDNDKAGNRACHDADVRVRPLRPPLLRLLLCGPAALVFRPGREQRLLVPGAQRNDAELALAEQVQRFI